jgi:hypothetical protein
MRAILAGGLLMALACAPEAYASGADASDCDRMVGVWEYVPPSAPGHAVIARQGSRYLGIFVNTLPEPYSEQAPSRDAGQKAGASPDQYSVAGVWEYTCDVAPGGLRVRLHWLYSSYRPQDVGTDAVLEVEVAGSQAKWWFLGPDGKRGTMGAGRLLNK